MSLNEVTCVPKKTMVTSWITSQLVLPTPFPPPLASTCNPGKITLVVLFLLVFVLFFFQLFAWFLLMSFSWKSFILFSNARFFPKLIKKLICTNFQKKWRIFLRKLYFFSKAMDLFPNSWNYFFKTDEIFKKDWWSFFRIWWTFFFKSLIFFKLVVLFIVLNFFLN